MLPGVKQMKQAVSTDSHPARIYCANCMGDGFIVMGWSEIECPDCEGAGVLLDLDGIREDEKEPS